MATAPTPSRGEIWLINFDPSVGAEIRKVRPAVVMNLDSIGRLPLRVVVPLTDWKPQYDTYPWMVNIPVDNDNGLAKESGADCFQVKSLAIDRFDRLLGEVTADQLDAIASALALCVGAP
jgi:mRNA interferase MazF